MQLWFSCWPSVDHGPTPPSFPGCVAASTFGALPWRFGTRCLPSGKKTSFLWKVVLLIKLLCLVFVVFTMSYIYIYVQYVLYGFLYRNSSCIVYKHLCPCSCHVAFELLGPVVLSPCWSRLRARPAITTRGTHTSFQPGRATKATSHWRDAHSASLWLNIAIGPYA